MTQHVTDASQDVPIALERPVGLRQHRAGVGASATLLRQTGSPAPAFRGRLLKGLLQGGKVSKRRLRAIEYVAYHVLTSKDGGVRRLRPAAVRKEILAQCGIAAERRVAADVERRYLRIIDRILAVRHLKELEAEGWLEKVRAIKYGLGKRFLTQEAIQASVACLLVLERMASFRGFRGEYQPKRAAWALGRLPVEPPFEQPALPPDAKAVVDIWDQFEMVSDPLPAGRAARVGLQPAGQRDGREKTPPRGRAVLPASSDTGVSGQRLGIARRPEATRDGVAGVPRPQAPPSIDAGEPGSPRQVPAVSLQAGSRDSLGVMSRGPGQSAPGFAHAVRVIDNPPLPPWEVEAQRRARAAGKSAGKAVGKGRRRRNAPGSQAVHGGLGRVRTGLMSLTVLFVLSALLAVGHVLLGDPVPVPARSEHYQAYQVEGTAAADLISSARRLDGTLMLTAKPSWYGLDVKEQHRKMGAWAGAWLGMEGIRAITVVGEDGQVLAEARGHGVSVTRLRPKTGPVQGPDSTRVAVSVSSRGD